MNIQIILIEYVAVNNVDKYQTAYEQFDHGLHCLSFSQLFRMTIFNFESLALDSVKMDGSLTEIQSYVVEALF